MDAIAWAALHAVMSSLLPNITPILLLPNIIIVYMHAYGSMARDERVCVDTIKMLCTSRDNMIHSAEVRPRY